MAWLNIFLILCLVIVPTTFGALKMPTEMGLATLTIAVAMFFANLDKFSRFKGAGFEAELRTAVDKTYAALEQLKELALALTSPIIGELAVSGRMFQFIHLKYKLEDVKKIAQTLAKLGASEDEIQEVCGVIYDRVRSDHIRAILHQVKIANEDKDNLFIDFDNWKFSEWDKARVEKFIKDNSLIVSQEANELITDLDYFLSTKKLRREDRW